MFFEEVRRGCCNSSASVLSCFDETSELEAIKGDEDQDGVQDAEQADADRVEDGLVGVRDGVRDEDRDGVRDAEQVDEASYTLKCNLHILYKQESI